MMKSCMFDQYRDCYDDCTAFYVDGSGDIQCRRCDKSIYKNKTTLSEALKEKNAAT